MAHLQVHDLSYYISQRNHKFSLKSDQKYILEGVSLNFKPGLTAILGPSGCGKTTLIDVLSGRKNSNQINCSFFRINGHQVELDDLSSICGYVAQDDLIHGTLTVSENIKFSSELRSFSEEHDSKTENIVRKLGLTRCKDTQIGHSSVGATIIRGVSGGERKRTAIGMELVTDAELLFLDEPTSGLDSSTSLAVVKLLQKISTEKTVIMSIHQPRANIWKLFDNVVIMSTGNVLFHGTPENSIQWISDLGYPLPDYENPADHIMDTLQSLQDDNKKLSEKWETLKKPLKKSTTIRDSIKRNQVCQWTQFKVLCSRSSKVSCYEMIQIFLTQK